MSFLKKAAGIFVEIDETPEPETAVKPVHQNQGLNSFTGALGNISSSTNNIGNFIAVPTVFSTNTTQQHSSNTNQTSNEFIEHFKQTMDEANLPGPDYYEFAKMVDTLTMIPDEASRIKAAYTALNVQGVTKELLISSAKQYVEILNKDRESFIQALQSTVDSAVNQRLNEIALNEQRMKDAQARIEALQTELASFALLNEKLKTEADEASKKVSESEKIYTQTHDKFVNKIQSDINVINTIL